MATNPVFDDILFPLGLSTGSTGGPTFRTSVTAAASGYEQRNAAWPNGRLKWTLSKDLVKPATRDILVQFFRARKGRLRAFRFRDPFDNQAFGQVLNYTGGLSFQLIKVYGDAASAETRIIKKPVAGTVTLTRDGAAFTAAGNWSIDTSTGIGTFASDQAGHTIAASFTFDVPARFDVDEMSLSLENNYVSWGNVAILEEFLP